MKVAGRSDCYITSVYAANPNHRINEEYSSIVNFLTSSFCQDLGIQLIAGNRGQAPVGSTYFGYWDESNATGPRTFAVFRFLSASQGPFECMIWACSGSAQTPNPMSPSGVTVTTAMGTTTSTDAAVGISFACHVSGSITSPWNGGTSLTSASIGSPVWQTGSFGELSVFPRQNAIGGSNAATRNYLQLIHSDNITANIDMATQIRMHIIASENSLSIIRTPSANSAVITTFGAFSPRFGSAYGSPYFMFTNGGLTTAALNLPAYVVNTTVFGTTTANLRTAVTNYDGGISHPYMTAGSGTLAGTLYTLSGQTDTVTPGGVNQFVNSGTYEILPLWVGIRESPFYGLLGSVEHMYAGFGMTQNSLTPTSSSIAVGSVLANGVKLIFPWSGSFPAAGGTDRSGRDWSLTDWIPG